MKKLLLAISISWIWSCDSDRCAKTTICTKIFAFVSVQIQDQNGDLVTLDSTKTYKSGTIIYSETEMENDMEFYVILNDSHKNMVEPSGTEVNFRAWKDGQLVFDEPFIIGHDCCHIQKIDGKNSIIL